MGYWGKIIGGMAGFAMGGPFGAVVGAAIGHAADNSGIQNVRLPFTSEAAWNPARIAALLGRKEQLFATGVVVLCAKLAKCDGPVKRQEIDAFKRQFRIPPDSVRDIGRLFDHARASADGYEPFADQLGEAFSDNRGLLEDVLAALFTVARADGPVNQREQAFLRRVHRGFRLERGTWERNTGPSAGSSGAHQPPSTAMEIDAYGVLGVARNASDDTVRATWKRLMRENHPDSLAARGVPAEFIRRANDKVARINAAWDRIKRERGL
jgi:DnaJ like chaperone protein